MRSRDENGRNDEGVYYILWRSIEEGSGIVDGLPHIRGYPLLFGTGISVLKDHP